MAPRAPPPMVGYGQPQYQPAPTGKPQYPTQPQYQPQPTGQPQFQPPTGQPQYQPPPTAQPSVHKFLTVKHLAK